ncbi:MAG: homocysteine S-methyltransferase family protein [Almyronema sp.]
MAKYREHLPQLQNTFISDGGLETTLIFHHGLELPDFAAFDLLKTAAGYQILYDYCRSYAELARAYQVGLILDSVTWRANPDWGTRLGYDALALATVNQQAIALLQTIRREYETATSPIVISGCLGPRGDGYNPAILMSAAEAAQYHQRQILDFKAAEADLITAYTLNYSAEAIGITQAAQAADIPVAISFTVETDGCLPTGQTLKQAILEVDAATDAAPAYYLINCAHPTHFATAIAVDEPWRDRIRGIRANASRRSHTELDEADDLDDGNPAELGQQYRELRRKLPQLTILGGCCGTDYRHIAAICQACLPAAWAQLSPKLLKL